MHCSDVGIATYGSRGNFHHNNVHDIDGSTGSGNTRWAMGIEGGDWNKMDDNVLDVFLVGVSTGSVGGEDPQFWSICRNMITGMTGAAVGGHALYIKARHGVCRDNIIDEIVAYGAGGNWCAGCMIDSGATMVEFGNKFNGSGAYLAYQINAEDDLKFLGDEFYGTPYAGWYIAGACNRTQFLGFKFEDCQRGVYFDDASQCDNNLIGGGFMIYSASVVGINAQNQDYLSIGSGYIVDCALGLDISNANSVCNFCNGVNFEGCTTDVNAAGATNARWGTNIDQNGNLDVGVEP